MDMKLVEKFLIEECGYRSIEDAIKNTPKLNLYPIYGKIDNNDKKIDDK